MAQQVIVFLPGLVPLNVLKIWMFMVSSTSITKILAGKISDLICQRNETISETVSQLRKKITLRRNFYEEQEYIEKAGDGREVL